MKRMVLNHRWRFALGAALLWCGCRPSISPPVLPPLSTAEPPLVRVPSLGRAFQTLLDERRESVLSSSESAEAWGRYGQVLEAAEFFAEAQECYAKASALDPDSARWAHLLGLLQLQDLPVQGLSNLVRAAQRAPESNDAPRVRLAQALVERGRFPEAEVHLAYLTGRLSGHAAAHLEWARIRFAQHQESEASTWLTPCLTNPFTARPAMLLLSQIRAREGRSELAGQIARKAGAMPKPFDWPDPYQREVQGMRQGWTFRADRVQSLLAQGRLAEAEAELKVFREEAPENTEGLLLAGRLSLQRRNCAEAEARFRDHVRLAGETVNGLNQLSLALLCQQKWAEAQDVLATLLRLKPDFAQAHANLAIARSRSGDSGGAIASYREAVRHAPEDAGSHAGLAEEYARIGKREEALSQVDRALFLDPQQVRAKALRDRILGSPER